MDASEATAPQMQLHVSNGQGIAQENPSQDDQQTGGVLGGVGGASSQSASQWLSVDTDVPAELRPLVNRFFNDVATHYSATAQGNYQSQSRDLDERLSSLGREHDALLQSTTLATEQHQEQLRLVQERLETEHANVVRLMAELDTSNTAVRAAETALSATTLLVTAANNARDAAVTAGDAAVTAANNARDAAKLALANMTARLMAMITGVPVPPAADTATGQGASAANGGEGAQ